jgi:hypothetical protein
MAILGVELQPMVATHVGMRRRDVQVFVSYTWSKNRESSAVNKFTKQFEEALESSFPGAKVFQDTRDLPKGGPLENRLEKALRKSDVLLILVSSAWLDSEWCGWEFDKFKYTRQEKSPRIVPVFWLDTTVLDEAASKNSIACELAAIYRANSGDTRSDDEPVSVREIAELAEQVVERICESERKESVGPDIREDSPKNQTNAVGPNKVKTPPRKPPLA